MCIAPVFGITTQLKLAQYPSEPYGNNLFWRQNPTRERFFSVGVGYFSVLTPEKTAHYGNGLNIDKDSWFSQKG